MGRSYTSRLLLLCFLLFVFFNNGFGRKLADMSVLEDHAIAAAIELKGNSREMMELDYAETGPNTNGRSVYPLPSLPQASPPPPPPPPPPPLPPPDSGY